MEVYLSFSPEKLKTLHLEHSITITDSSINHSLRFSTSIISNRQHAADARAFLEANAEVVLFPYPFSSHHLEVRTEVLKPVCIPRITSLHSSHHTRDSPDQMVTTIWKVGTFRLFIYVFIK